MTTIERYRQAADEVLAEWGDRNDTGGIALLRQAFQLDEERRHTDECNDANDRSAREICLCDE